LNFKVDNFCALWKSLRKIKIWQARLSSTRRHSALLQRCRCRPPLSVASTLLPTCLPLSFASTPFAAACLLCCCMPPLLAVLLHAAAAAVGFAAAAPAMEPGLSIESGSAIRVAVLAVVGSCHLPTSPNLDSGLHRVRARRRMPPLDGLLGQFPSSSPVQAATPSLQPCASPSRPPRRRHSPEPEPRLRVDPALQRPPSSAPATPSSPPPELGIVADAGAPLSRSCPRTFLRAGAPRQSPSHSPRWVTPSVAPPPSSFLYRSLSFASKEPRFSPPCPPPSRRSPPCTPPRRPSAAGAFRQLSAQRSVPAQLATARGLARKPAGQAQQASPGAGGV
jgi:hypothetical protein